MGIENAALPGLSTSNFGIRRVAEGILTVSWDDALGQSQILEDSMSLFDVHFKVIGAEGSKTALVFTSSVTPTEMHWGSDLQPMRVETRQGDVTVAGTPGSFNLSSFPNPFNPTTTLSYSLPTNEVVRLIIIDVLGRTVATLVHEAQPAGRYNVEFNAKDLPSGLYYAHLSVGASSKTQAMILIK